MIIAIIDDGINPYICSSLVPEYDLCITKDCKVRRRKENERVITSHGTTCGMIIQKYAPRAQLCSLKVFWDEKLSASIDQLICALNWCAENNIPIIHMSIGSTSLRDDKALHKSISFLSRQNQIVVAAHCHGYQYTMPACYTNVLGVCALASLKDNQILICPDSDIEQVRIFASSNHELHYPGGYVHRTEIANSYAAPTVTAAVHSILESNSGSSLQIQDIYSKLAAKTVNVTRLRADFVSEAIICNPLHAPINVDHIQADVLLETDNSGDLVNALNKYPKASVILFPPAQLSWLDASQYSRSVLYAGFPIFETVFEPQIYWNEAKYKEDILRLNRKKLHFSVPTVLVDTLDGCENALIALSDAMKEAGYNCVVISPQKYAYLYGFEYLPEGIEIKTLYNVVNTLYKPDIVFICQNSGCVIKQDLLYLEFNDSVSLSTNTLFIPKEPGDIDIKKAIELIENFFI